MRKKRLTNHMRHLIRRGVNGAWKDRRPALIEKAQALMTESILATYPVQLREAYRDHPDYFRSSWHYFGMEHHGITVPYLPDDPYAMEKHAAAAQSVMDEVERLDEEFKRATKDLQAALASVATVEELAERFPELVPFLNENDRTNLVDRTVPVDDGPIKAFLSKYL